MTMNVANRVFVDSDFLSTGLTLLNLACYGRVFGGMCKGFIYRVIGKSQSAKSFLCRTILAEAANNPNFAKHELIHDDIENGVLMDNVKFFGQKLASRVMAPAYSKDRKPIYSRYIMDLYGRMNKKLDKGIPFIWIVDSQDSLLSMGTTKMGDGKAKIHADQMRQINDDRLAATGSIVIFVHHAKVNMSQTFSWGPKPDVTTGGASPEFYSTLDIRLSKLGVLKKKLPNKEKKYPVGNQIMAHITKNRLTGMDRTVKFPLYVSYGIDDLGSCVDWLVENDHWKKGKGGVLICDEFDFEGTQMKLISHIEKNNQERELRILVGQVWKSIEDACRLKRNPRYS